MVRTETKKMIRWREQQLKRWREQQRGVAVHHRVKEVKQVPNGTNTYLLEIEKEEGSRSSYRIG